MQLLQIGFTVIAGIGGDDGGVVGKGAGLLDHRQQQALLRTGAVCLGGDDDLAGRVHGGCARIALDDAFGGGHLGAVVIGHIALALGPFATATCGARLMRVQKLADRCRFRVECMDALLLGLLLDCMLSLRALRIALAMHLQHLLDALLDPLCLMRQLGMDAISGLARVTRQFDAVDGKHLAADQALPVANEDDVGVDGGIVSAALVNPFRSSRRISINVLKYNRLLGCRNV